MPARVVESEHDAPPAPGAGFLGEGFQERFEERLRHAVADVPEGLSRRGRDERGHIQPFEAVMAVREGPVADRRPDPPRHRFQADPVLVGGERLDRNAGVPGRFLGDGVRDFF